MKTDTKKSENKYLSRKFLFALLLVLIATVLVGMDKLSGVEYLTLIISTVGGYFGANVSQKIWG